MRHESARKSDGTDTIHFGVEESIFATDELPWGVEKRFASETGWRGVDGDFVMASRAMIRRLRNSAWSIPERMSSDKLPSVNSRLATVWGGVGVKEGVLPVIEVVVETKVEEPKYLGSAKKNSRVIDFDGARQSTVCVRTVERKVK